MKHAALAAAAALASSLISLPSMAQGVDEFGAYGGLENAGRERTEQSVAFEVRVGQYPTRIDDQVAGSPYQDTFGKKKRWQAGAELDWQLVRIKHTLSFGPALGFAYTNATAKAPLAGGGGLSAQDTRLNIFPIHLLGVLRFDMIADRTLVPLAPYAKLGLGYALWWSIDGEQGAQANGVAGKDTSYGWVMALGLVFRLDWLDPAGAATADAALGLNHSGLFIEWLRSDLSGFGSADVMDVGTSSWVAGLALEF